MAVPKQKQSKSRTRRRRNQKKIISSKLTSCSHCKKPILPHRVCPYCGYYKEKEVIDVLEKL